MPKNKSSSNQPNILLITSDQQRFDACGRAGPSFLKTPHFSLLANEGITFDRTYADCPVCVPSRVSIMSGKTIFSHGMATNEPTSKVLGQENTLPACMKNLGYQSVAIGKMHFGPIRMRHGFDEMILAADYYRQMERSGLMFQPMRDGLGLNEIYPCLSSVPENLTLTNWTVERSLEFIRERRDPTVPFFLWCSFLKPHPPFDPPEPYYSMYRNSPIPDPVYGDWSEGDRCPDIFKRFQQANSYNEIPVEVIREARAAYYGLITQIDYNVGRLFGALNDIRQLDNTLIMYTSDHGEYLGDHHAGSKWFFHEASARVPMVIRLPRTWKNRCQGTTVSSLATLADILPTLVAAAGGTAPKECDGQDLIATARGELPKPRKFLEATSQVGAGLAYFGITDAHWKYMYYPEGGTDQLFDLQTDPQELHDLANEPEFQEKRKELRREMIRRHLARKSPYVRAGDFIKKPASSEPMEQLRNINLAGFHTEFSSGC